MPGRDDGRTPNTRQRLKLTIACNTATRKQDNAWSKAARLPSPKETGVQAREQQECDAIMRHKGPKPKNSSKACRPAGLWTENLQITCSTTYEIIYVYIHTQLPVSLVEGPIPDWSSTQNLPTFPERRACESTLSILRILVPGCIPILRSLVQKSRRVLEASKPAATDSKACRSEQPVFLRGGTRPPHAATSRHSIRMHA